MAYLTTDKSAQDGQPIYLYRFANEYGTFRYTSRAEPYVRSNDGTYIPLTITHGDMSSSGDMAKDGLDIQIPRSLDLAYKLVSGLVETPTSVTILKGHSTDQNAEFIVQWRGRVSAATADGAGVSLSCESVFSSMRRAGLRARFQRNCRHPIYGRGCNVDSEDFGVAAAVEAIAGSTLTIKSALIYPTTDPHFNNVSLLLNGDDATIRDSGPLGKTVNGFNQTVIDTGTKIFGAGSIAFNSTTSYATTVADSAFDFGTGDFTIEFWVRPRAFTGTQFLLRANQNAVSSPAFWMILYSDRNVRFEAYNNSQPSPVFRVSSTNAPFTANTWTHVAVTRYTNPDTGGRVCALFINGSRVSVDGAAAAVAAPYAGSLLTLGSSGGGSDPLNGNIDEFRITKGVARYSDSFLTQTAPFPSISQSDPSAVPPNYFLGGMLRTAGGVVRYVSEHNGTTIRLLRPIDGLQLNETVTMYPGCDKSRKTCDERFSNLLNFGGYPWIPTQNPFGGSSIV